jgi:hypothetical protein
MIRPLLSLERLSFLKPEGKAGYRHGQDTAEQETIWRGGSADFRLSATPAAVGLPDLGLRPSLDIF